MKRYLVKVTETATEKNIKRKGETCVFYIGQGYVEKYEHRVEGFASSYGYKRKAEATKYIKTAKVDSNWDACYEVIEYEC